MSAADACHMRDSVSEPRLPLKPDIDSEGPSHTTQRAPSLNFVLEADSILEVSQRAEEQSRLFLSPSNRVQLPMDTGKKLFKLKTLWEFISSFFVGLFLQSLSLSLALSSLPSLAHITQTLY